MPTLASSVERKPSASGYGGAEESASCALPSLERKASIDTSDPSTPTSPRPPPPARKASLIGASGVASVADVEVEGERWRSNSGSHRSIIHKVLTAVRERVSADKSRYSDSKYDLDLSYITDRVIAMAYPASGFEATYRNSIAEVAAMLKGMCSFAASLFSSSWCRPANHRITTARHDMPLDPAAFHISFSHPSHPALVLLCTIRHNLQGPNI